MSLAALLSDPVIGLHYKRILGEEFDSVDGAAPPSRSIVPDTTAGKKRRSRRRASNLPDITDMATVPVDIFETASSFELYADAPGLGPEDIKVELHEGVLTLSGERKSTHDKKDKGEPLRNERRSFIFTRSFVLPDNANGEGICATMEKGVLKVTVPKRKADAKAGPRRIAISKL